MDQFVKKKMDDFFSKYKNQKFRKGEILIRADDDPAGIFYLKEGVVKRYSISHNGEELVLNIYRPISFFPMSWAVNGTTSPHYYEAMTAVEVWRAPKDDVNAFIKANPEVALDLLSRIYRGLEGYMMRMEYLMVGDAQSRLITELLIYTRRFGEKSGEKIIIKLKLTEKDIASQTGISRETVSRELQKLTKKGLISFKNNQLTINNIKELEAGLLGD